jgi:hypothetical protein
MTRAIEVREACAYFFGVAINEQQAESEIVVSVTSTAQSKFKVLLMPFFRMIPLSLSVSLLQFCSS